MHVLNHLLMSILPLTTLATARPNCAATASANVDEVTSHLNLTRTRAIVLADDVRSLNQGNFTETHEVRQSLCFLDPAVYLLSG